MAMSISASALAQYEEEGFLLVKGLVEPVAVEALGRRLQEYPHGGRSQATLQSKWSRAFKGAS